MVFLDNNILLEVFFDRDRKDAVGAVLGKHKDEVFAVSTLSINFFMYQVEKEGVEKSDAWAFLSNYAFVDTTVEDVEWARWNDQGDYEDALQTACALRHGCSELITLDQRFANQYGSHIKITTIR